MEKEKEKVEPKDDVKMEEEKAEEVEKVEPKDEVEFKEYVDLKGVHVLRQGYEVHRIEEGNSGEYGHQEILKQAAIDLSASGSSESTLSASWVATTE